MVYNCYCQVCHHRTTVLLQLKRFYVKNSVLAGNNKLYSLCCLLFLQLLILAHSIYYIYTTNYLQIITSSTKFAFVLIWILRNTSACCFNLNLFVQLRVVTATSDPLSLILTVAKCSSTLVSFVKETGLKPIRSYDTALEVRDAFNYVLFLHFKNPLMFKIVNAKYIITIEIIFQNNIIPRILPIAPSMNPIILLLLIK